MTQIHPSSIISDGAKIGKNVSIGAFCTIGKDSVIGDNCRIHSHVVIEGMTTIGNECEIFPFAAVGTPPQDLKYGGEKSRLVIGDRCTIRENATIHTGTADDAMETRVGNDCLIMVAAHIAHDCIVGNNVIMANNATLGGHVKVGDGAIIGGLSAVHQFVRIGKGAIIGGMSGVEADVLPYALIKGDRASLAGLNLIGLERSGIKRAQVRDIQKLYNQIFASNDTLNDRIEKAKLDFSGDVIAQEILAFASERSKFSICKPKA